MCAIVDQKWFEECLPLIELWLIENTANYLSNCAKEYEKGLSASHLSINYCNEYLKSVENKSICEQLIEVSDRLIVQFVSHNQMSEASRISNLKHVINALTHALPNAMTNTLPNTAQGLCDASAVQQQSMETRSEFTTNAGQTQRTGSKPKKISEPQTNGSKVSHQLKRKSNAKQSPSAAPKESKFDPKCRIEELNKVTIKHNYKQDGIKLKCTLCEHSYPTRTHIIIGHLFTTKHLEHVFGIGKVDLNSLLDEYTKSVPPPMTNKRNAITREVALDLNGLHALIAAHLNPPSNASTLNLNDSDTIELPGHSGDPIQLNQNTDQNTSNKSMIDDNIKNPEPFPSETFDIKTCLLLENKAMTYEDNPMPSLPDTPSPVAVLDFFLSSQQSVDQMSDQTDGQTGKPQPLKSPNSDPFMGL